MIGFDSEQEQVKPAMGYAPGQVVFEDRKGQVFFRFRHSTGKDTIERAAAPEDFQRYPIEYEAFKSGRKGVGTPLTALPDVTEDLAGELRYLGIFSVEGLAALGDTGRIPNGHVLRKQAKEHLDRVRADTVRLEAEAREMEIAELKRLVREQGEQLAAMTKGKRS